MIKQILSTSHYYGIICLAFVISFPIKSAIYPIALLALVCLINIFSKTFKVRFKSPLTLFALLNLLILILGLINTNDINEGLFLIEKKASLIILPFLFSIDLNYNNKKINAISIAFGLGNIASSIGCFITIYYYHYYITGRYPEPYWGNLTTSGFLTRYWDIHPTYFSLHILFSIVLLAGFLFERIKTKKYKQIWIYAAIILVQLFVFFRLAGRTPIMVFFIMLTSLLLYNFLKTNKKLIWTLVPILGVLFFSVSKVPIFRYKFQNSIAAAFGDRIERFKIAFEIILQNPLFGVGTGDVQSILDNEYIISGHEAWVGFNTHNEFVEVLLRNGIIGLLIFVIFIFFPFFKRPKNCILYLLIAIFILCSQTEVLLNRQHGIVFFMLFYSLFFFNQFKISLYNCNN